MTILYIYFLYHILPAIYAYVSQVASFQVFRRICHLLFMYRMRAPCPYIHAIIIVLH